MRSLLIGLTVLVTAGCRGKDDSGKSPPQSNEQASLNGLALTLDVDHGRCRLVYGEADQARPILLALSPPCRFAHGGGTEIRTEQYASNGDTATVLIVIGGAVERDPMTPVTLRTDCGNRWQAVLIGDGTAVPTSRIGAGVACAGVGLDEKEYRMFYDLR